MCRQVPDDIIMTSRDISENTFPECYEHDTWSVDTRWKEIWLSMCQQVRYWACASSYWKTSRDISEKHTSQNAMNMKLGQ